MDLILVRHGKAEDVSAEGDRGRVLTEKGRNQSRAVGRLLLKMELLPDLVFASPRARAVETGVGVMAGAELSGQPVVQEWLDFSLSNQNLMAELAALPSEIRCVVLVGHEPSFSALVEWLLGAEGGGYAEMKKAAAAHFQISPPSRRGAVLKMLVPPRVLL